MSDFKLRPMHRRRKGRRKRVEVLNQQELAQRLGVGVPQLRQRLDELSWKYHQDSTGALWATPPTEPTDKAHCQPPATTPHHG
jgi:hypothetical protein